MTSLSRCRSQNSPGEGPHTFPTSLRSQQLSSLDWNSRMPLGKLQALTLVTSSMLSASGRREGSKHTPHSCSPSWCQGLHWELRPRDTHRAQSVSWEPHRSTQGYNLVS